MALLTTVLLFAIGIVLVVKGGDLFVDAASWIAEISGIPRLIVGATIVSLATTMPEMLVSVMAATQGKVDMSIGNAVGSVTANIGLIMAISLIFMPVRIARGDYLIKSALMLAAAALVVLCGMTGSISLVFSLLLMAIFAVFFVENVAAARRAVASRQEEERKAAQANRKTVAINAAKFIAGAIGIVWGADLLVDNGGELARIVGISERIIGVTLVAVGTSLPELITTVTAIAKKQSSLSVGNILGANIIDLTLIMPLSALISGQALPVSAAAARIDLPVCLLVGVLALVPALAREKFTRAQGCLLLGVYAAYVVATCVA